MREKFEKILLDKLYDLPADRPVPSWAEMQRRMTLSENASGLPPRHPRRLWPYGVAAALIAVMLGVGLYQLDRQREDIVADLPTVTGNFAFPLPEAHPQSEPLSFEEIAPSKGTSALSQLMQSAVSVTTLNPSQVNPLLQVNSDSAPLEGFNISPLESESIQLGSLTPGVVSGQGNRESSQNRSGASTGRTTATAGYGSDFDWDRFTENQERRPWTLSAYTGAYAASRIDRGGGNFRLLPLSALMFNNAYSPLPAFQGEDLDHHFPISVGLSVRKHLTRRWALETGLVYSYLEATGEMTDGSYRDQYRQQVHYLGIPLYASYSLFNNNRWDIYLNGGFMTEVPLSAKSRTRYFNPRGELTGVDYANLGSKGLLWSTSMGAGVNYYMLNNFGLYLEPGVSYYFSNPNQPYTYHTRHPWSFNLRVGFRVRF